jgi:hypothetical protein
VSKNRVDLSILLYVAYINSGTHDVTIFLHRDERSPKLTLFLDEQYLQKTTTKCYKDISALET